MRNYILIGIMMMLAGCATIPTTDGVDASKVLATATNINNITGTLMKTVGPFIVVGLCVTQPEYCIPAKSAYSLALAAQKEYAQLLADATTANQAPDGMKLATLAATIRVHLLEVNKLIVAAGGVDNSSVLTDLSSNITELQAESAK